MTSVKLTDVQVRAIFFAWTDREEVLRIDATSFRSSTRKVLARLGLVEDRTWSALTRSGTAIFRALQVPTSVHADVVLRDGVWVVIDKRCGSVVATVDVPADGPAHCAAKNAGAAPSESADDDDDDASAPSEPMQRHELEAWLGDDHGLTEVQVTELLAVARDLERQYPGSDNADTRDAALIDSLTAMVAAEQAPTTERAASMLNAREWWVLASVFDAPWYTVFATGKAPGWVAAANSLVGKGLLAYQGAPDFSFIVTDLGKDVLGKMRADRTEKPEPDSGTADQVKLPPVNDRSLGDHEHDSFCGNYPFAFGYLGQAVAMYLDGACDKEGLRASLARATRCLRYSGQLTEHHSDWAGYDNAS